MTPPELAHHLGGPDVGPPVVLLHAFPLDRTMFDGVAERLERRTVLIDLPGTGGSAVPDGEPSLDLAADGVAAVLDRLGHPAAVLAGCSMGGYVAMAFARRHPQRVLGLALIDTKAEADTAAAAANRERLAVAVTEQGIGAIEAALPPLLGATSRRERPALVGQVRRQALAASPAGVAWSQRAMAARPDSTAGLAALRVPTVVVVGEEDELIGVEQARGLAAAIPGAVFVPLPQVGHLAPLEQPDRVAAALREHLRPGPAAGSPPRA